MAYFLVYAGLLPVAVFAQSSGLADAEPGIDRTNSSQGYQADRKNNATQIVALNDSEELSISLQNELNKKGADYLPRTEHLNQDGTPRYINRLILEDSPYLIQHAHNPVNWYPWGAEAFARAAAENKPVFMSIGYATCHWCHVMERESFENEAIAKILNDSYISIKVDREQRPDVDATYMTAVQMIAGSGGWPMSSFLTADAKPFYGGTYFPPEAFTELLERVAVLWDNQKEALLAEAEKLSNAVADSNRLRNEGTAVGTGVISLAVESLLDNMDELQGGFSAAPKFPQEPAHFLLLEQALLKQDKTLLDASDFTLTQMSAGGIHDQIGGGFHRYSIDPAWLVPHFEKMLYNQAALARIYYQVFSLTNDAGHLRTAQRILDYVYREMTSPEGGFYSATDADSEGEEGLYFIWTLEQLKAVLGDEDAKFAAAVWNITEEGNFEHANILNMNGSFAEIASEFGLSAQEFTSRLDRVGSTLLNARETRVPPLLDDKLITEWNGMMITAFAQVGSGLGINQYLDVAKKAADTIWSLNRLSSDTSSSPGLWRAHFNGRSSVEASQPDYAFFAEAMLALYDATGSGVWLSRAEQLVAEMDAGFWDSVEGAYFLGVKKVGGAELPARPKDIFDNATPSGNAAALRVLTRLWHRTGKDRYQERANQLLSAFSGSLTRYVSGFGYFLTAASELIHGESGPLRYAGRGNVKIKGTIVADNRLKISVDIKPGWHMNSASPLQNYLIPTRLLDIEDKEITGVQYPEGSRQSLGFQQSELSLYEGNFELSAPIENINLPNRPDLKQLANMLTVSLQLQACNDQSCLAPETVRLRISAARTEPD